MAIVSLLNIYIVSMAFDLDELGLYGLFLALASYMTQFGSFGFNQYALRQIAAEPSVALGESFFVNQLAFLLSIFPLSIFGVFAFSYFDFMKDLNALLVIFYVFLCVFNNAFENYFVSKERPGRAASAAAFRSLWVLLLGTLFILKGDASVDNAVLIMICFEVVCLIVNVIQKRSVFYFIHSIDWAWNKAGIKVGVTYLVIGLCVLMSISIQRFFLYEYSGEEISGAFYFLLLVFTFFPNFFEVVFFSVVLPKLVKDKSIGLGYQIILATTVTFAFSIALLLFLPSILSFANKDSLMDYQNTMMFFAVYAPVYVSFRVLFNNLYARGEDRVVLISVIVGALVSILSSYVFIALLNFAVLGALLSVSLVALSTGGALLILSNNSMCKRVSYVD